MVLLRAERKGHPDRVTPAAAPAPADVDVSIDVITTDGTPIAARFRAPTTAVRGAVLVVPAMGVSQGYYAALATWLTEHGYAVATFDYRGTGRSRRGPLREVEADLLTWAEQDVAAVLAALAARAPGVPITWLGHSLGGQLIPFVPGAERVAKVITIATGSGYWRENAAPLRRKVWLFWFGAVPVATALCGYFPGKRLGMVGDLPRGVIRQWKAWCLDPAYAVGVLGSARARFAAVRTPITSLSFTDDEMMSARNTESLHGFYEGAPRTMTRLAPADVGLARIGHFGFFRPEMRAPLWDAHLRGELA